MDLFPEIFGGSPSALTGLSFAMGFADQTPGGGNFAVAELFNPTAQSGADNLVTVCGFVLAAGAAGVFQVLKSASATDVSSAATAGPFWMDGRRTDSSLATFKMGTPAPIPGTLATGFLIPGAATTPIIIPFNYDLTPGQGLNFAFNVAATRAGITVFWIERARTS